MLYGKMWIRGAPLLMLAILSLFTTVMSEEELDGIDFDNDDFTDDKISTSLKIVDDILTNNTEKVRDTITSAMKRPEKRDQIGQVLPIIRSMSPPQKLVMATLISSRITNNGSTPTPLEGIRSFLAYENTDNATRELMLPISMDIAKILSDDIPEELPEAQELRHMPFNRRRRPFFRPPPKRLPSLNRRNVYPGSRPLRPGKKPTTEVKEGPTEKECTFFSHTICLEILDYPYEAILRSIRSNKEIITALLTDYTVQDSGGHEDELSALSLVNRFENNEIKKRADVPASFLDNNVEAGFVCSSQIKYARPQLARSVSGVWKYIINTGEHTQTLRLEKCTNPRTSCSYISENYRSSCVQVYNYHRLLTWDSSLGLHMDIFKVPTCCSCHVHGYSELFPPHQKDPPSNPKESFPGVDIATEDQNEFYGDFSKSSNFINKYGPSKNFESTPSIVLSDGPSNSYSNDPGKVSQLDYEVPSNKKPFSETTITRRPGHTIPGRSRPKKQPASVLRPFDKLPQQHAPNTRAPGYTGSVTKGSKSSRPNRPFRRETDSHLEYLGSRRNGTDSIRYSQQYDQYVDATRLPNGTFDDEYQEQQKRINYNYHPIIDFFSPEVSMLQSPQPQPSAQSIAVQSNFDSWKPMISP